ASRSRRRPSLRRWFEHSKPPMKKLLNSVGWYIFGLVSGCLFGQRLAVLGAFASLGPVLGFLDTLVQRQRLAHDLVHVVVLVGAEPADEGHARRLVRQLLVALVQLGVLRPRNGVVGVALGRGIFVGNAGLRMDLSGQVLVLADAGVGHVLARIVDRADRLELFLVELLVLELQRAIGQLAEAVVEVLVDGAAEDQLVV